MTKNTADLLCIGNGTYGDVYLSGEYAIKEILCEEDEGPIMEMAIMGLNLHPNIIKLISVTREDRYILLKMPYVRYTLSDIDDTELELAIDRIIDAMAHLHSAGIMHRDIKPNNILISSDGEPFICDFSLSLISDKADSIVCSLGHRPPEVHLGHDYGKDIDVWSLGVTILDVLNNRDGGLYDDVQEIIDTVGATEDEVNRFMTKYSITGLKSRESQIEDGYLGNLARSMLKINPEDRPSFASLSKNNPVSKHATELLRDKLGQDHVKCLTEDYKTGMWDATIKYIE